MLRKRVWRKAANDAVSWHQDESLNTTIFILKEFGPTGFLLKEDREPKNYKVRFFKTISGNCLYLSGVSQSFWVKNKQTNRQKHFRYSWVILTRALVEPSRKRRTSANTSAGR